MFRRLASYAARLVSRATTTPKPTVVHIEFLFDTHTRYLGAKKLVEIVMANQMSFNNKIIEISMDDATDTITIAADTDTATDAARKANNAASGMAVHDDCKIKFMALKTKRTHRFIVFKIEEKQKEVIVEKVGGTYEDFVACLPADECRYAVFDYDFMTVPKKSMIFFIGWSPDTASVQEKMIYTSSKDWFKRELDGIRIELQAADPMDFDLLKI